MAVTALFASVLGLLYLVISARVMAVRRVAGRLPADDAELATQLRLRVHRNFAEYVPIVLTLLGLAESLSAPFPVLFAIGSFLVAGRCLHVAALSCEPEHQALRMAGMVCTLLALGLGSLTDLSLAIGTYRS